MEQLELDKLLNRYVPNAHGAEIPPAQVLCLVIMNIMVSPSPLYRVEDWLQDYLDGIAEQRFDAAKYNDDRIGRELDHLFTADRASLLTELSARAIRVHQLLMDTIHNDTTSITFTGAYKEESDSKTPKITYGYNKDHRPDCKQLVFGLNTTADGHVPISFQLYDGNRADVTTHQVNWEQLRAMLGKETFIYVADSKACSRDNLQLIAQNGGQFITVVPRNVIEVKAFLQRVRAGEEIVWQHGYSIPNSRKKGCVTHYRLHEGEQLDGNRVLWVYSDAKARQEREARENKIAKAEQALTEIANVLNTYNLKTRDQIEARIDGVTDFLTVTLHEDKVKERVQVGKGRPGPNTRYQEVEKSRYSLEWHRDEAAIEVDQRADGLFPLVDNTALEPVEVLRTYKQQANLEKRFSNHKSVLEVAPVFLEKPERIEAMMFLYFVALMLISLIERRIRLQMQEQGIKRLPLRPDGSNTEKPTWRTIRDSFSRVHLASVTRGGKVIHESVKGVDALRRQLLQLLQVPITVYMQLGDRWWRFALE